MEFHKDEVKNKVVWTKGADITDGSPRYLSLIHISEPTRH